MPLPNDDTDEQLEATLTTPTEPAEDAPEDPFEAALAERGLSREKALEIIQNATDHDAQERAREQDEQRAQDFEQQFNQKFRAEGGQRFASALRDPGFAQKALAHIAANHPHLVPEEAGEPDPDPTVEMTRRTQAELRAVQRELQELREEQRERFGQVAAQAHIQDVGLALEAFVGRSSDAQKAESYLIEELKDAYESNPRRFANPARDVPAFLKTKMQRLSGVGAVAAPASPKFTPPRRAAGRPGAAPARRSLPDLSPDVLASEALAFMRSGGGSAGEE